MDTQAWQRLAEKLTERRATLRPEWSERTTFARDTGLSYRSLSDLETARRDNYKTSWLAKVEKAYQWEPGSIQRILVGETPAEGEASPAHRPQGAGPLSASEQWDGEIVGPAAPLHEGEVLRWRDLPDRRVWELEMEGLTYEAQMRPGQKPEEVIDVLRRMFARRVAAANSMMMERAHDQG
ncbi:hypothetical protein [Nocardiopsis sp. NRRL B-16309]|uniref:hypothetical protein n=1 Tax=Nocardiopsis sp. NRRL B-16309 TaxID=1519494 RepID=UPI0006AF25FE|nr:hypothetical protein [Nocardiopsis sp. NRRL B-16309]KOX10197.1 hypothetical protein ADL05_26355 [Nocardiopsis sp. NRRL B-16309]